jgi:hypothetical protein
VQDLLDLFKKLHKEEHEAISSGQIVSDRADLEEDWRPHIIAKIEKPQVKPHHNNCNNGFVTKNNASRLSMLSMKSLMLLTESWLLEVTWVLNAHSSKFLSSKKH